MGMTLVPSRPTKCVRGRLCVCVCDGSISGPFPTEICLFSGQKRVLNGQFTPWGFDSGGILAQFQALSPLKSACFLAKKV